MKVVPETVAVAVGVTMIAAGAIVAEAEDAAEAAGAQTTVRSQAVRRMNIIQQLLVPCPRRPWLSRVRQDN